MKENVIVVFGGKSAEHDISIITGLQAISNVDRSKFNVIPLYISQENQFFVGEKLCYLQSFMPFDKSKFIQAGFVAGCNKLFISKKNRNIYFKGEKPLKQTVNLSTKISQKPYKLRHLVPHIEIHCAIVCCHGKYGEDGSLQGLLNMCGIPFTSCEVLSSAITMDKVIMKDVLKSNKIKTAKHVFVNKTDFVLDSDIVIEKIEQELEYPLFIKPANLGSSIGISKCNNREELNIGIEVAICYDSRILVEKAIENNIEVNCAVLGNVDYCVCSDVEIPNKKDAFLTFDEKYIQRNESAYKENNENYNLINEELQNKIKEISIKAFKVFNCKGVVRIDFLIDKNTNEVYLNELNSIPGSLSFYLFKNCGYEFKNLLNNLIDNAKKAQRENEKLNSNYVSTALKNINTSIKMNK